MSQQNDKQPVETHLFVLVHGLWGGPNHMLTIEKSIRELLDKLPETDGRPKERIATIRPSSFRFWKTYDGIRLNAERVISDVLYEIELIKQQQNSKVTKISFVGYSLGGLISRYAIGILNELGVFDVIKPVFFTTFATPHVGVHFFNDTLFDKMANATGVYLFGKTGKEMFLGDEDKLLIKMVDPEGVWFSGLAKFEKHMLLANVKNDRTVAFFTSYITEYSPFEEWDKVKIKYLKGLPHVRIGKVTVRPKFVDFHRSIPLDPERKNASLADANNDQEETSFLRRNKTIRFLLIVCVTLFILPLWIPLVLSSSIFASAYSAIKILIIKHPELKKHWARVKDGVYGETIPIDAEDAKIGLHNRDQRRKLRHSESFKGDTSNFTKSAMENFMYAEERLAGRSAKIEEQQEGGEREGEWENKDDDDDDDDDEEEAGATDTQGSKDQKQVQETVATTSVPGSPAQDNSETGSLLGLTSKSSNVAKQKIIDVDIAANDESITTHLGKLYVDDYSKFPLFTKKSVLNVDEERRYIIERLNSLKWIKIPVYIDAWNAHDGIVARRGPRTNPKGTASILLWASILRQHVMGVLDTAESNE